MGTLSTALQIARGTSSRVGAGRELQQRGTTYLGGLAFLRDGIKLSGVDKDLQHSAIAYRALALIASNLATVPMVVVDDDGEADDRDPIAMLWNRGGSSDSVSMRVTREVMYARAELQGESFAYIDRGPTGTATPRGMHVIWDRVDVVTKRDEQGSRAASERVVGYIVKRPGGDVPLLPTEVLWLRYPHPTDPWGSLAPWKAALYPVESDAYARAWQRAEFRNGARPSQIISLGDVSAEVYERALAQIRTRAEGPDNAGKSLVLRSQPGSTIKPEVQHLSLSPAEMSYLETRVHHAEEVLRAFGIPKDILLGGATYENQRAAKTALWSDTLLPKLDVVGSEFDRQLVPDPRRHVGWDLSGVDALRESQDAVIKRASDATQADLTTIDEARAMIGLDPLPGGMGQYTLTAYRERMRLTAQTEVLGLDLLRSSSEPRRVRTSGRTITVRTPQQRAATVVHRDRLTDTLRAYDRHERIGKRAIARLAERQEKAVIRELKAQHRRDPQQLQQRIAELVAGQAAGLCELREDDYGVTVLHFHEQPSDEQLQRIGAGDLFDVRHWIAETVRALEDFMTGAWSEGGERTAGLLGASWDHLDPLVIAKMTERAQVLASLVTTTTRAALDAQLLQAGVEAGESIDKLAERLRKVFSDLSSWRAETIARTETVGGYNAAAHEVAANSGLVVQRRWLATDDARTRRTHRELDGMVVTGTEGTYGASGLRFPGDPLGRPSETINCRCVELFETD